VTLLMGESPAGLNATGAADIRGFYDNVAAWRKSDIEPGLKRILKCVLAEARQGLGAAESVDGSANAGEPEWDIKWPSLYQPTDKEKAEVRKIVADTDSVYITSGVLDPTEVTLSRFGEGGWSMETTVDLELREKMADNLGEDDIKPPAPEDPNAASKDVENPNPKVAAKDVAPGAAVDA
jgi:hypothetical protein